MKPTHRHPDGGVYEYVGPASHKNDTTGAWEDCVAYRGEDGRIRTTSKQRWAERFEEIKWDNHQQTQVSVEFEEGPFATFTFDTWDAGDIRHMMISAGPGPNSNLLPVQRDWLQRVLACQAEAVVKGLYVRDHDFPDMIGDVSAFHAKFGQEYNGKPRALPADLHEFRIKFHDEETHEYRDEYPRLVDAIARKDRRDIINSLELQLDALVDAAWVILGTADIQFGRHAFIEAWKRVVKANMAKVRAVDDANAEDSGREVKYDIRKPAGWMAPDHRDLVSDNAIFDEIFGQHEEPVESNTFNQEA